MFSIYISLSCFARIRFIYICYQYSMFRYIFKTFICIYWVKVKVKIQDLGCVAFLYHLLLNWTWLTRLYDIVHIVSLSMINGQMNEWIGQPHNLAAFYFFWVPFHLFLMLLLMLYYASIVQYFYFIVFFSFYNQKKIMFMYAKLLSYTKLSSQNYYINWILLLLLNLVLLSFFFFVVNVTLYNCLYIWNLIESNNNNVYTSPIWTLSKIFFCFSFWSNKTMYKCSFPLNEWKIYFCICWK